MIIQDSMTHTKEAVAIYKHSGSFSGLNWAKTVVNPLWEETLSVCTKRLGTVCPDSDSMDFSPWGADLGFAFGPDRINHMWSKAKGTLMLRANIWKDSHQGLH